MDKAMVLAVTYGLPSAGKSTRVKRMIEVLKTMEEYKEWDFLHLEVDCLESLMKILDKLSRDLESLKKQLALGQSLVYDFDKQANDKAREEALALSNYLVQEYSFGHQKSKKFFLFVDDNHLIKSARKQYMRLSRKNEIPYVELYFEISVDLAVIRSSQRVGKIINKEVILKDLEVAELQSGPFTLTVSQDSISDEDIIKSFLQISHSSVEKFRAFNEGKNKVIEPEPKSNLSEIEELLRQQVNSYIIQQRQINPHFSKQILLSQLKKEFYVYLKQMMQEDPYSPELTASKIKSNFIELIEKRILQH